MDQEILQLAKRLEKHPHIRARMEAILNVAENSTNEFSNADLAELQLIQEVRKLGADSLHAWAKRQEQVATDTYKEKFANDSACHGKKN